MQSPARSARTAVWHDTSEDEQAVSIVSEGPVQPSAKDTRPQATLLVAPGDTGSQVSTNMILL